MKYCYWQSTKMKYYSLLHLESQKCSVPERLQFLTMRTEELGDDECTAGLIVFVYCYVKKCLLAFAWHWRNMDSKIRRTEEWKLHHCIVLNLNQITTILGHSTTKATGQQNTKKNMPALSFIQTFPPLIRVETRAIALGCKACGSFGAQLMRKPLVKLA